VRALFRGFSFLLAASVLAPRLEAQPRTAQVSALEGKADRARGAQRQPLAVGSGLSQGDVIETQKDSRLELRFSDASVLRLGPRAKLQLAEAHFGGPSRRRLSAKLFFGKLWAKVTSVIQGDQKFQVETENAVAGVRGTQFLVDARADKSVLVRVYDGQVAVAKPTYATGKPGEERREVEGPQEVTREQWEKLVGRQMQILVAADGSPGDPQPFDADADDDFSRWNQERDAAKK
jgi:hypothetical protein